MTTKVEVVLTPAELTRLATVDLRRTTCVVFDVLRATSTIAAALHHGAREVVVVGEIAEALSLRSTDPELILAGERNGQRISSALTGSVDFDLGNSPREFTRQTIAGRRIVMTTTNGTRALRGCVGAASILATSFLNLSPTANLLADSPPERLLVVCAGTGDGFSLEDTLGAGALLSLLPSDQFNTSLDACAMAMQLHRSMRQDLEHALASSLNGRRLLADPELREDVAFCARRDVVATPVQVANNIARFTSSSGKDVPA